MKNKKNIIILLILMLSVGVTMAYFTSTSALENEFKSGKYKTVTEENFTSPTNWKPGDTTPKTITTTNEGTLPVKVRVKLTESWKSENNDDLPLRFKDIPMVIINFANANDWNKDGDYYYYVGELAPGETTSSLIESVTFNSATPSDVNCSNEANVYTCESTGDGYDGGTYTLKITTETVQADAITSAWNLSYDPTEERTIYDISDENEYSTYDETNKNVFLRKTIIGITPRVQEVGFILNGNVYYLKGGGATNNELTNRPNSDSIYYNENKMTLLNAYGSENCEELVSPEGIQCSLSDIHAGADTEGRVYGAIGESWSCNITDEIHIGCIDGVID